MPELETAQAYPRKHFFVEMFTRDISLIDCVLDLVDNAVDGLIRDRKIDLGASLLTPGDQADQNGVASIQIDYSDRQFSIVDNCGGIGLEQAKKDVFNFGHSHGYEKEIQQHQLGVYGVGLKRAIFKIGRHFTMTSRTASEGFQVAEDLDNWVKNDRRLSDWTFPLKTVSHVNEASQAGTSITIKGLRDEVRMAIEDPTFEARLRRTIAQTYALFLNRYVRIAVKGRAVESVPIPIGGSAEVEPSTESFVEDGVNVLLIASVASRTASQQWTQEQAGWYIACNGRLVITADKSELTGWGTGALPAFHSKYRGFVGLALFQSHNPLKLPWRTTKRGLNEEARVYQLARGKMSATARPITSFLDKMYPRESVPENWAREVAGGVAQMDVRSLAQRRPSGFKVTPEREHKLKTTVRVQFDAERVDLERIKKHIRRPDLSAGAVGKYAFDEYIANERL